VQDVKTDGKDLNQIGQLLVGPEGSPVTMTVKRSNGDVLSTTISRASRGGAPDPLKPIYSTIATPQLLLSRTPVNATGALGTARENTVSDRAAASAVTINTGRQSSVQTEGLVLLQARLASAEEVIGKLQGMVVTSASQHETSLRLSLSMVRLILLLESGEEQER